MTKFMFRVERSDAPDVEFAIAAWKLAFASRVDLGDIAEDGMTTIEVTMADDWESGPDQMVAWVKSKIGIDPTSQQPS